MRAAFSCPISATQIRAVQDSCSQAQFGPSPNPEIGIGQVLLGARGGVRTRMTLRPGGFKPPASANSATRAGARLQAIATRPQVTPMAGTDSP